MELLGSGLLRWRSRFQHRILGPIIRLVLVINESSKCTKIFRGKGLGPDNRHSGGVYSIIGDYLAPFGAVKPLRCGQMPVIERAVPQRELVWSRMAVFFLLKGFDHTGGSRPAIYYKKHIVWNVYLHTAAASHIPFSKYLACNCDDLELGQFKVIQVQSS